MCAEILWRWFEARILVKDYPNAHKPFKYKVEQIKDIIYAFVIFFGYNFEEGVHEEFYRIFEEWLEDLKVSPKSNTWRAPYGVFCIENAYRKDKKFDKKYATLTAVVIWDILLDNGLRELCKIEPNNEAYPDLDGIMDMIENVNINVLDPHVNYKDDSGILERLNLI